MTIHITPEPGYSYVSFETNYPQSSYYDLINRLLKTFNPGQFIVTLMTNEVTQQLRRTRTNKRICVQASVASNSNKLDFKQADSYHAYQRKELQFARVKSYDITYGL